MSKRDSAASRVVVLPATIDLTNAEQVADQLEAAADDGGLVVVGDLSATRFCDSAGLRQLLLTTRQAATRGVDVRLAAAHNPLLRVMELVGATRLLHLYPSVADALADETVRPG
jgi:anti-anti-sigma factor